MTDFDVRAFRNTLGSFPTGVCVVTTMKDGTLPFGMTVNSFASVSLEPALVLWSIQRHSDCFGVFESSDSFGISVLNADQQDISNRYAKPGAHDLLAPDHVVTEAGVPLINSAIATFECKVWQRIDGGDHVIIIGEVEAFKHVSEQQPLVFHAGRYAALA